MTLISRDTPLVEVAALVCSTLEKHGVVVALSGGAVVSIYAENAYESYDLDFVATGLAKKVDDAMYELGFRRKGRCWVHPDSPYWVEFPPGPVQVGDSIVSDFEFRETRLGKLRLLTPTDSVMDRLAGYYHWQDPQCLEQAVLVASHQEVDLHRIEDWSRREGAEREFLVFLEKLESTKE